MKRLSRKQLEEMAREYAKSKGKEYGYGLGNIQLKDTDARISPYNYRLVEYTNAGGGLTAITEALTARQMYEFLIYN